MSGVSEALIPASTMANVTDGRHTEIIRSGYFRKGHVPCLIASVRPRLEPLFRVQYSTVQSVLHTTCTPRRSLQHWVHAGHVRSKVYRKVLGSLSLVEATCHVLQQDSGAFFEVFFEISRQALSLPHRLDVTSGTP